MKPSGTEKNIVVGTMILGDHPIIHDVARICLVGANISGLAQDQKQESLP